MTHKLILPLISLLISILVLTYVYAEKYKEPELTLHIADVTYHCESVRTP